MSFRDFVASGAVPESAGPEEAQRAYEEHCRRAQQQQQHQGGGGGGYWRAEFERRGKHDPAARARHDPRRAEQLLRERRTEAQRAAERVAAELAGGELDPSAAGFEQGTRGAQPAPAPAPAAAAAAPPSGAGEEAAPSVAAVGEGAAAAAEGDAPAPMDAQGAGAPAAAAAAPTTQQQHHHHHQPPAYRPRTAPSAAWRPLRVAHDLRQALRLVARLDREKGLPAEGLNPLLPAPVAGGAADDEQQQAEEQQQPKQQEGGDAEMADAAAPPPPPPPAPTSADWWPLEEGEQEAAEATAAWRGVLRALEQASPSCPALVAAAELERLVEQAAASGACGGDVAAVNAAAGAAGGEEGSDNAAASASLVPTDLSLALERALGQLDLLLTWLWRVHAVDYYLGREAVEPDEWAAARGEGSARRTLRGARRPAGMSAAEAAEAAAAAAAAGGAEQKQAPAADADAAAAPEADAAAQAAAAQQKKRVVDLGAAELARNVDTWAARRLCPTAADPSTPPPPPPHLDPHLLARCRRRDLKLALDAWVESQIEMHDEKRWGNKLSAKMFVEKRFVVKHVLTKHPEKVAQAKEEAVEKVFFEGWRRREQQVEEAERRAGRGGGGGERSGRGGGGRGERGGRFGGGRGGMGGGGRGMGRGMGPGFLPVIDPSAIGPILLPGAGGGAPVIVSAEALMGGGGGGGGGRGGRGGGGGPGNAAPRVYHDLDHPANNRAVLSYDDI
jgi:hypothetical protein